MRSITVLTLISFSGALFALIPAGGMLQKLLAIWIALIAIVMNYNQPLSRGALKLIWVFFIYIVVAALSALTYSFSVTYVLLVIQPLILCVIFYVWMISRRLGADDLTRIRKLVYLIIVVQFLFSLIKLVVHGIDEKILIGTMSHTAGQLGFLFPAIAVPLLIFMMNKKNQLTTWLLITAMFLFGIINEKRSIIFLLPLIIIASLTVNPAETASRIRYKHGGKVLFGGIIAVGGAILGVSVIPSFNEAEGYGGGIPLLSAFNYAIEYLMMDYGGSLQGSYLAAANDTGIQVGRVTLLMSIIEWLRSVDILTLLFGMGFGAVTPSAWVHEGSDLLFNAIETRGAISGVGLAAIETGIVGMSIISFLFIYIYLVLFAAVRKARSFTARRWFKTLMIVQFVFCYDFFFYSIVLLRTMPMPLIFTAMIASIPLVKRWDGEFLMRETAIKKP